MNYFGAFTPTGTTQTLAVTNVSSSDGTTGTGNILRLVNVGATECFVRVSSATNLAATAEDLPIPGNTIQYLCVHEGALEVYAITAAGTTTLRVTRGTLG